jgi:hypothetical protein
MAADGVVLHSGRKHFGYGQACHRVYACDNCISLESQLKEALQELSSSKFIIKLLYKEPNDASAIQKSVRDASIVSGVCEELVLPIAWPKVASKYSGGEKEAVNSELLHSRQPIPVSNRYSVLTYLPESTIGEDEMASLGSGRVTQLYTNNYKKNN